MTNLISSASVKSDWQPSPWEVRIIVDCQCANMTENKTAALLGIEPETLARWHAWRIYWSARYTILESLPEPAVVATPLEEPASEPPPSADAPSSWIDMVRVAAAGGPVAAADEVEDAL